MSKTKNPDFNGVMNFISQFNKWACERISQVGGVEIGEVKIKNKGTVRFGIVLKKLF